VRRYRRRLRTTNVAETGNASATGDDDADASDEDTTEGDVTRIGFVGDLMLGRSQRAVGRRRQS